MVVLQRAGTPVHHEIHSGAGLVHQADDRPRAAPGRVSEDRKCLDVDTSTRARAASDKRIMDALQTAERGLHHRVGQVDHHQLNAATGLEH